MTPTHLCIGALHWRGWGLALYPKQTRDPAHPFLMPLRLPFPAWQPVFTFPSISSWNNTSCLYLARDVQELSLREVMSLFTESLLSTTLTLYTCVNSNYTLSMIAMEPSLVSDIKR